MVKNSPVIVALQKNLKQYMEDDIRTCWYSLLCLVLKQLMGKILCIIEAKQTFSLSALRNGCLLSMHYGTDPTSNINGLLTEKGRLITHA